MVILLKSLDVVTLGETMVLFSTHDHMSLEYAHHVTKQIAGAESNVAIGLSRLGVKTGWFSKLGEDPFGRYVHKIIRGEGVDTSEVLFTGEANTSVFFKEKVSAENVNVYYYRKGSAASLLKKSDLNEDYLSSARFLHVTGITPALSESCKEAVLHAICLARSNGLTVVFDPNIRYKLWKDQEEARRVLLEIASLSDYILPGVDEALFLTGEHDYSKAANALLTRDDQTVIMKLGAEGAYYSSKHESGEVSGYPVKRVVDPVGAGDGFAAGVISSLVEGCTVPEAVERGNAVGSFVVQMNGDVEGLPTMKQLEQFMTSGKRHADVER